MKNITLTNEEYKLLLETLTLATLHNTYNFYEYEGDPKDKYCKILTRKNKKIYNLEEKIKEQVGDNHAKDKA